jgi:hypothetical protein
MTQDQLIFAGMGGMPVAVNQLAIHKTMELYEIEDRVATFEKVVKVSRHIIGKQNEEQKAK